MQNRSRRLFQNTLERHTGDATWLCARLSLIMEWFLPAPRTQQPTRNWSASQACRSTSSSASTGKTATTTDAGKLTGIAFWQKFVRDTRLNLPEAAIHELNRLDVRMWSTVNPRMVAWQEQLRQHGLKRAILSNMGDAVRDSIVIEHAWINTFDVLIWSYELGIIKPNPAIYRAVLDKLDMQPEETLFLDDRSEKHSGSPRTWHASHHLLHRRQAA